MPDDLYMADNLMLFTTTEERLCHTCERPISIGEELILEFGPTLFHHVKCVDLCPACLAVLRKEEAEFKADDAAETAKLVQEMSERERCIIQKITNT